MMNDHLWNDSLWSLDEEIQHLAQMAQHWQNQARSYESKPSGELIKEIAAGYALQLQALQNMKPVS